MKASTLRAIRARLGLNQVEFGRQVGYGFNSISEMERRKRDIPRTLALAALALEAGIDDTESSDGLRVLDDNNR